MGHSAKSQSVLVFGDGVTILRRCRVVQRQSEQISGARKGGFSWVFAAKRSLVENSRVADVIDWDGSYGCPVQTAPHSGLASNTACYAHLSRAAFDQDSARHRAWPVVNFSVRSSLVHCTDTPQHSRCEHEGRFLPLPGFREQTVDGLFRKLIDSADRKEHPASVVQGG